MMKLPFVVLLVASLRVSPTFSQKVFECGVSKIIINEIITHGYNSVRGAWPWHVAIYRQEEVDDKYICGGTLITQQHILTAAHCLTDARKNEKTQLIDNIFVKLGVYQLNSTDNEAERRMIKTIHQAGGFLRKKLRNDIAILELTIEAEFDENIQPACVSLTMDFTGQLGTVIGWGLDESDQVPNVMKSARLPVIDFNTCLMSNRVVFGGKLDEGIFCAGYTNGTAVCNGDSGGGIFFEENGAWHLGGLVSFSQLRKDLTRRCLIGGYAGFTRIHTYLAWIKSVTKLQLPIDEDQCEVKDVDENANYANLLPRDCGIDNFKNSVQPNNTFQIPWMAMLLKYVRVRNDEVCAGSLIHTRYVLASAYCAYPQEVTRVQIGVDCIAGDGCTFLKMYGIECVIKHPSATSIIERYSTSNFNNEVFVSNSIALMQTDIALVRLDRDVVFDEYIRPICLPVAQSQRNLALSQYLITGWTIPPYPAFYNSTITTDPAVCRNVLGAENTSFDGILCITKPYRARVCRLAIGCPLGNYVKHNGERFVLFGIMFSFHQNCSLSHATNIEKHMGWILANIHP